MLSSADVAKLLKLAQTLWSSFTPDDDIAFVIETWQDVFAAWTYDDVADALKASSGDFMPSLPSLRSKLDHRDDPSEEEALRLANLWWRYLDQSRYTNGSGFTPERPVGVPESVKTVVAALGGADANLERFRFVWRDRLR